jgi:DeoR/GlpR family transcriptional regulator of sugar metabolism
MDSLSSVERRQKILTFLSHQQRISVIEICEMFGVSEATARRDLEVLSEQSHLQRVHGGAISLRQAPPELPILQRERDQSEEKERIAKIAANLLTEGSTIFLGSGTTVLEVARKLRDRKNLTIITNSLPVLNMLSGLQEINLIALGGFFRVSELSFIGHITEQALAEIRVDKVIIGVHAIDLVNGLTNDYLQETMTDRAILKCGKEVVVVADHTKINTVSIAYLAPINSIQKLITDRESPSEFISSLRDKGIEVLLA